MGAVHRAADDDVLKETYVSQENIVAITDPALLAEPVYNPKLEQYFQHTSPPATAVKGSWEASFANSGKPMPLYDPECGGYQPAAELLERYPEDFGTYHSEMQEENGGFRGAW